MYRYLFFDADGTLFDFDEAETRAFYQMTAKLGFEATSDQLEKYKACNEACWKAFERFEITQEKLKVKRFEDFFASEALGLDPILASRTYQGYLSQQGILYKESRPLLDALIERGYTLYLASNGIAEVQRGRIGQSQTGEYFKDIFISEEIGAQKPDAQFFSVMLGRTGLEAKKSECLMIGDSLSSDILGGFSYGLDTLWLNMEGAHTNRTQVKPTYEMHSLPEMLDLLVRL
ncbi:MAG: noncanonical pyrimidine nucleotidase, YjjG family [Spirochaetia bacterium]|jgi:putative hydrolase of the HAD superfamily|nr:noncanonical pyrimidine nucleotidase, YjjG family [Spirochaetia bacterium]